MAACTPLFRSLVLKHFLSNFQVWPPDQGPSSLKTTCSGTSPFAHFYQQLSLSLLRLFTLAFQGGLKSGALVYMLDYANRTFSAFHKTFSFIGRNNPHTNKITSSLGGRKIHLKKITPLMEQKPKKKKKKKKRIKKATHLIRGHSFHCYSFTKTNCQLPFSSFQP